MQLLSSSTTAPKTTATAGFTNVISVARVGPISAMSAKNTTNASPVHTAARASTADQALAGGTCAGRPTQASGATTIATAASDTATTPMLGTSARRRTTMNGPTE